jgi:hypothetical protein
MKCLSEEKKGTAMHSSQRSENRRGLSSSVLIVVLIFSVIGIILVQPWSPRQISTGSMKVSLPGQQIWKQGISSYLFGTNDTYEWLEHNIQTEPAIQMALRNAGFTLIRTFFPDNASDTVIEQRISTIEKSRAHCLGVITSISDVAFDEHLVRYLGNRCQMYEFGNEPDYYGVSIGTYLQQWNKVIPLLRQINPNAKFIGPVTQNDSGSHGYMLAFLQGVKTSAVLPDAVSFHWYPCYEDTRQSCLDKAGSFTQAVQNVRLLIQITLGKDLPVGISEWNYDSGNPPPAYGEEAEFIDKFTADALHSMAQSGVAFACQFDAASFAGYGRLDMFDLRNDQPKPQYYAIKNLIQEYRPS